MLKRQLSGKSASQKSQQSGKGRSAVKDDGVIEPDLTEEELAVYKRGRNAHSPTMAKHATMADYRRATGFEALMGYLYLKEDYSRIVELVRKGIRKRIYKEQQQ